MDSDHAVPASPKIVEPHLTHSRLFRNQRFVYPVLSRRSRGLSIGVNLNPDRVCNFDCVYCQIDRSEDAETRFVDLAGLLEELESTLDLVDSGRLYELAPFDHVPIELRGLRDIAFSGDGEPTTHRNLAEVVAAVGQLNERRLAAGTRLVLITNATRFHRPEIRRALDVLHTHRGEVWAKLDAGTNDYYRRVNRSAVSFELVLANLRDAACRHPLVIQSMFLSLEKAGPSREEVKAYGTRLVEILEAGGRIDRVQIYTVARSPAEREVGALPNAELEAIADQVRLRTRLPVEVFPGRCP